MSRSGNIIKQSVSLAILDHLSCCDGRRSKIAVKPAQTQQNGRSKLCDVHFWGDRHERFRGRLACRLEPIFMSLVRFMRPIEPQIGGLKPERTLHPLFEQHSPAALDH